MAIKKKVKNMKLPLTDEQLTGLKILANKNGLSLNGQVNRIAEDVFSVAGQPEIKETTDLQIRLDGKMHQVLRNRAKEYKMDMTELLTHYINQRTKGG